jgi:hypothetical protein
MTTRRHTLAIGHGLFFFVNGLWPVFHLKSFEKVTGPKTDGWLVKTVGLLLACTGAGLLLAGRRSRRVPGELAWVAAGQALTLASISSWYSLRGRISKIYLLDTLIESGLTAAWVRERKRAS